jgi:hypothetical protein
MLMLMAAMLEVCPRGSEKFILFPCLFLCRLSWQLCVLLARADLSDLKGQAEQADELWTHHAAEDLVAAVQQLSTEEDPIAAFVLVLLVLRMPEAPRGRRKALIKFSQLQLVHSILYDYCTPSLKGMWTTNNLPRTQKCKPICLTIS